MANSFGEKRRGFGTVQVVAAVAGLGILAALAFAAKSYVDGVGVREHARGVAEERARWQERESEELRLANERFDKLYKNYTAMANEHATRVNDISAQHQKELRDAQKRRDADIAAVNAGALRLRDQYARATAACESADGAAAPATSAAASRPDGRGGAELSPEASAFLLGEAGRADALALKIGKLQRLARTYYEDCAKPSS